MNLETIPTAYILLDGGTRSSVEIISNTTPLPMNKKDIIIAHALAGQFLGNKFIFLESGSGSENHAAADIVFNLSKIVDIPIIVGGGVHTSESAYNLVKSGAQYIVTGTQIEKKPNLNQLLKYTNAIHSI